MPRYHAVVGPALQPRISAISTNVSTSETTMEPRQPRRFEKKKNIALTVAIQVPASDRIEHSNSSTPVTPSAPIDPQRAQRLARRYEALASAEGGMLWVFNTRLEPTGRNPGWERY